MSELQDLLTDSQGTGEKQIKLIPDVRLSIRVNEEKPCFQYWDKEKKENVYKTKEISGIYVGYAMLISAYKETGSYVSEYYPKKDCLISLYEPKSSGYDMVVRGSVEELETFIIKNANGNAKKQLVIFLATKERGLVAIQTNITLGFDQLKQIDSEELKKKEIVLSPALYSKLNADVTNKAKTILGKLAEKNPPCYAQMKLGKEFKESEYPKVIEYIKTYLSWRIKKLEEANVSDVNKKDNTTVKPQELVNEPKNMVRKTNDILNEEEDDMPF